VLLFALRAVTNCVRRREGYEALTIALAFAEYE